MTDTQRPPHEWERRMTDAYSVGIEIAEMYRHGTPLVTAIGRASIGMETLEDAYPEWHPTPYAFEGMLRIFIYREITAESYHHVAEYPEIADEFGLEGMPGPSVLSRTWRERFDGDVREFVETAAHYVVKSSHDYDCAGPQIRPKSDVTTDETPGGGPDGDSGPEFSDGEIIRTTQLTRDHAFGQFDSKRTSNATYEDIQFFELQTFMGMVGCGTAQGAARFQHRRGTEYGPHVIRTSERSNNSLPRIFLTGSIVPQTEYFRLSSPKPRSVVP
jgi:hypothetical protein